MSIEIRAATDFDDAAAVIGPRSPTANVCFCLSYRLLSSRENNALRGPERGERVRALCAQAPPPGVLAYVDDEPAGWAAIHPRADTSFSKNRRIPKVDEVDVWSLWCVRVRPGFRKQGLVHHLIRGAVELAAQHGAPAVEAYPVDNGGERVDLTMAYVGTRAQFERAGFVKASDTTSVINGFPRVLMRKLLPAEGDAA